jgi:hypothetical protein
MARRIRDVVVRWRGGVRESCPVLGLLVCAVAMDIRCYYVRAAASFCLAFHLHVLL